MTIDDRLSSYHDNMTHGVSHATIREEGMSVPPALHRLQYIFTARRQSMYGNRRSLHRRWQ